MIETPIYKFKKRQLTDSPPNIEVGEDNWDEVEKQISILTTDRGYKDGKLITDFSPVNGINGVYWTEINNAQAPTLGVNSIFSFGRNQYQSAMLSIQAASNGGTACSPTAYIKNMNSGWKQLATTDKIDISLLNGWALVDGVRSVFKSGNIVSFNLGISSGTMTDGTILFTLPTGYRPSNTMAFVTTYNDASFAKKQCIISIDINGNVKLGEAITSNTRIILNISYGVV